MEQKVWMQNIAYECQNVVQDSKLYYCEQCFNTLLFNRCHVQIPAIFQNKSKNNKLNNGSLQRGFN